MARTRGGRGGGRRSDYPDVNSRAYPRRIFATDEGESSLKENLNRFEKSLGRKPDDFDLTLYENCPDIAKLWMIKDQRMPRVVDQQEVSWDGSFELLQHLPNELKLEIIDFVPTYSLHHEYRIRAENEQGNNLLKNSVKEECLYYMDKPLVTYHKMRLINKEYAKRMKFKILSTDSFDLTSFDEGIPADRKRLLYYFLALIRVQGLLERKEISFDGPFIYEGVEKIKDFDEKIFVNQNDMPLINEGNLSIKDKEEKQKSENIEAITIELDDEKLESLISEKVSSYANPTRPRRRYYDKVRKESKYLDKVVYYQNLTPIEKEFIHPYEKFPDYLNATFLEEISQYLGENNTIKHIAFSGMDTAFLNWILRALKGLKTIDFVAYNSPPYIYAIERFHNIERISFFNTCSIFVDEFENFANSLSSSCILESFLPEEEEYCEFNGSYAYFVNDQLESESNIDLTETITIYSHSSDTFTLNERMKKFLSYNFYTSPYRTKPLAFLLHHDKLSIVEKKNIMEFMVKEKKIPIEFLMSMHNNSDCLIASYVIYLANTYQNGRLHIMGIEALIFCLKHGWIPTAMMQEITLGILPVDYLNFAFNYLKNELSEKEFAKYLRSILICRITSGVEDNELFAIFSAIKKFLPQEEKHLLFEPVKCNAKKCAEKFLSSVTIPLLGLVFNNFQLGASILNEISESELLFQNELGDTILHLPLAHDNLLINMILEKQPKLAKIVNNSNSTILHNFTADNYYRIPVIHNLIHKFDADPNHRDIFGNTPFEESHFNFDTETGNISHRLD